MTQRWRSLLFLHFPADPAEIQALLPDGLSIDTFPDESGIEKAWIGLVSFRMEGITLSGFPEVPGIHAFPETNVRTYVHREGRSPGVWFFSLEAANTLACRFARRFFHLPYHEAKMSVRESSNVIQYRSRRRSDGCLCCIDCTLGEPLPPPEAGFLEFYLVERYLLYSAYQSEIFTGRVYHKPYPVRAARVGDHQEDLVGAVGIRPRAFTHALFSTGVDVEVFRLEIVVR